LHTVLNMRNIAIFASGSGTNAENIIRYFSNHNDVRVDSVWSNRQDSLALERARKLGIEDFHFTRDYFLDPRKLMANLQQRKIELIVLAGFLWLVPPHLLLSFPIINIHPALLPLYGGKGMYGLKVHEAVIHNGDKESGITIHLVNEEYDNGEILLQKRCPVFSNDTPETLAERVHRLEYEFFPKVIEEYLLKNRIIS
jgi:phosphoribosylglycinamide formyltransferase 1